MKIFGLLVVAMCVGSAFAYLPPAPDASNASEIGTSPMGKYTGPCLRFESCPGAVINKGCPKSAGNVKLCIAETREAHPRAEHVNLEEFMGYFKSIHRPRAEALLPYYNEALDQILTGVTQDTWCKRVAAFSAQIGVESAGLRYFEEIASGSAYNGRTDLGNTQAGDGPRYKGRGPIQLTGRNNYMKAGEDLALDIINDPEMVCFPSVGFKTTAHFWMSHNLNKYADAEQITTLSRRINGGNNGMAHRHELYNKYKPECDAKSKTTTRVIPSSNLPAGSMCYVQGAIGSCISTGSCSGVGGTSSPGHCKEPSADIQCCTLADDSSSETVTELEEDLSEEIASQESEALSEQEEQEEEEEDSFFIDPNAPSCSVNGLVGSCIDAATCQGDATSGHCPGASNIQCCTKKQSEAEEELSFFVDPTAPSCTANGLTGSCIDTGVCAGDSTSGLCAGPSSIQCCTPHQEESAPVHPDAPAPANNPFSVDPADSDCEANGDAGKCQDRAQCGGLSTGGLCPGAANIQCCTPFDWDQCESEFGTPVMMDAYRKGAKLDPIGVIKLRGKNVEVKTACAFLKMERAYGSYIRLTSGFRTYNEQAYLRGCYDAKRRGARNYCNNGNLAARPGWSNHQNGIALDLSVGDKGTAVYQWLKGNAQKYGFVRTVPSENWHWEYRPGAPAAHYT